MTVKQWIWIDGVKHDFDSFSEEKKNDCFIKIELQVYKSQGIKPADQWLKDNPTYADYWDRLHGRVPETEKSR